MVNTLMTSINAREDVFILGPLSHIIAREYTQMTSTKQRRRVRQTKFFSVILYYNFSFFQSGENKVALLLIDRHLDLATPSSHQQDTLLAQILHILPNIRIKSADGCQERTIDIKVDSQALLKTPSSVLPLISMKILEKTSFMIVDRNSRMIFTPTYSVI